jgi:hypothetical protein
VFDAIEYLLLQILQFAGQVHEVVASFDRYHRGPSCLACKLNGLKRYIRSVSMRFLGRSLLPRHMV